MRSVVVVGAGVFGVTSALELRRRRWDVALLDPGPLPHPDASSTDISKAIRMDYGADELYAALAEEAIAGWERWNQRWGEALYHEDGVVFLSSGTLRPGGFEHDSFELLRRRGQRLERLDSRRLRARFPAWSAERYAQGYFNPRGGWAESGRVVARLLDEAAQAGVEIHTGVTFARLVEDGIRVKGFVSRDGSVFVSHQLVVAAGTWTPALLPHLAEVMWSVGQPVLHFQPTHPEAFRPPAFVPWVADVANTGWYGFTALADGTLKIANHGPGKRMHPDDLREVTADHEATFRGFLRESLPALAQAPIIGRRLCLYCDTWDGNFWIDRDPEREGLVVAAGGSGHAFKLAPLLGGIIADVVEGRPNRFTHRFAWRDKGRRATEGARFSG